MDAATPGFRGWWMVGMGFLTQALAVGVTFGSFPVFLVPIAQAFEASRTEVSVGLSLLMFTSTTMGVIVGPLLDGRSIRSIMSWGALLFALCLLLMSRATALWQLGVLFGVGMALGVAMMGPLASATLVAKWFERLLGRAQGVTNMGGPAGAGLFSILGGALIVELGWRGTLAVYGGVMVLVIPLILLVVRNRPEDLGQWPDGASPPSTVAGAGTASAWSMKALAGARRFWLLVVPVGVLMGVATGWGSQVVSLGGDLGFSNASASSVFGVSALLGILGTLVFGSLADRTSGRTLLWILMGMHALGFCALSIAPDRGLFYVVVPVLGFLGGGMMPVYAALIGQLFGQVSFGQVMGLGGLIMAPFAVIAPTLGAGLRDGTGSYVATLLAFAGSMLLAGLLLAGLRAGSVRGRDAVASASGALGNPAPEVE